MCIGCQQHNEQKFADGKLKNCAATQKIIDELIERSDSPLVVSKKIRQEYLQSSKECRELIYFKTFDKLFFTSYVNPENDPNEENLQFFIQQGNENDDQLKIKLRSLFVATGYLLYIKHDADSALHFLAKTKTYQNTFNDSLRQSYETLMSQCMLQEGNMQEAVSHLLNAIDACEKMKDSSGMIANYGNLAVVYSEMGDEEKAIPIMRMNLKYFLNNDNKDYALIAYVGLANSFTNVGKIDSAVYCSGKALELIKNGIKNVNVESTLYMNVGRLYIILGDYEVAKYYFNLAKITLENSGSDTDKKLYQIFSGPAFASDKGMSQEIKDIENNISFFNKKKDYVNVRNGWESLYRIALIKGNFTDALEYYKSLDSTKKILSNKNSSQFISELQTKFETQKKEAKIESQQKEIARKNLFINILIVILVIGFLIAAFIITRNRLAENLRESTYQQKFTKRILEKTEEERQRLSRDLIEVLGPELLVLKQKAQHGEEILTSEIDTIINEIRGLSRTIHPVMLEQIGLKDSIHHLCDQLMEKERIFITAEIDELPKLSVTQDLQIFRILQIVIKNILKHAHAEAAKIKLYMVEKNCIVLEVQDNGKGFDVDHTLENLPAFDLINIIERSKAMNGTAQFESDDKGTKVTVKIPVFSKKIISDQVIKKNSSKNLL